MKHSSGILGWGAGEGETIRSEIFNTELKAMALLILRKCIYTAAEAGIQIMVKIYKH